MDQANETVGLAAPVLGIHSDDRSDLTTLPCQADQDGLQEFTNPTGRVTMPEEDRRVGVFFGGCVVDDLSQVSRKLLVLGRACLNVGHRPAGFKGLVKK
jgi:hypothetical protein